MKLVVEIVGGARRGRRFEFDDPPSLKFGRHPSCDVPFDAEIDRDASSRHAELRREGAVYCLYDLDSANGTVVDGRPAHGRTPIAPGAEIEFGAGGPRCRIHYVGIAATVPPTILKPGAKLPPPALVGQRTVALMIEEALRGARASGRLRMIAVALAAALVAGAFAVVAMARLRARRPSAAEIARAAHDAIFLVAVRMASGEESGFCSAFAVSPTLLVTNAHCVAAAEDFQQRGGVVSAVQNGHSKARFAVRRMRRIAGFRAGGDAITPDVGWLRVDGPLPQTVELAPRDEYHALAVGDRIYEYGFPGRLSDVSAPEATFVDGVIGRITRLDGHAGGVGDAALIQHSAFTSGGTSGSPIFDGEGRVVAVNTGGYVEKGDEDKPRPLAGYSFGMRVDLVEALLKEAGQ